MISRYERLSFSISEIHRYLHSIAADEMEKFGLKGPYAIYLLTLYRYDEGITSSKLSEITCRNKADVSRAMMAMEEKGLLYREGATYRAKLFLTKEGRDIAAAIGERARIAVEIGGKGLTEEQRETMYYAMDVIAENLRNVSIEGLPLKIIDEKQAGV